MSENPSLSVEDITNEILILDPRETLPTEDMIKQGIKDFRLVIESLPPDVEPLNAAAIPGDTLRYRLLSQKKVRGCFMGFTAEASSLAWVSENNLKALQAHIESSTDQRIRMFHLGAMVNMPAVQRIVKAYGKIFPPEALEDTYGWINDLLSGTVENDRERYKYIGLLSGFPPESVRLFCRAIPSDKAETIPGIGIFTFYGTDSEQEYIHQAKQLYESSKIEELVRELLKDS